MARELRNSGGMKRSNMRRFLTRLLPGLLLVGTLGACTVRGHARTGYHGSGVVYVEPPPPRRHVVVYRPGYVYVEGRQHWDGNRYVWRDGYYERERPGYVYRPGRWTRSGRGHVWVEGRWDTGNNHRRTDRRRSRDHRY